MGWGLEGKRGGIRGKEGKGIRGNRGEKLVLRNVKRRSVDYG